MKVLKDVKVDECKHTIKKRGYVQWHHWADDRPKLVRNKRSARSASCGCFHVKCARGQRDEQI